MFLLQLPHPLLLQKEKENKEENLNSTSMKQFFERVNAPTPKFFRKLRNIGLILATVATTVAAAPMALPAVVIQIAGYLAVAGGVLGAVSQTTMEGE